MKTYYVYALLRETSVPFYIGLGGRSERWLDHEKYAKRGRSHKDNIICKMRAAGLKVGKVKLSEGMEKQEAVALEINLIRLLGRHPNGPLANATAGGDGVIDLSEEKRAQIGMKTRDRQLGKPLSAIHRARVSASHKGVPLSPEHRASLRGAKRSDEARANISAAQRGKKRAFSAHHRAALSAAAKRRALANPDQLKECWERSRQCRRA